MTESVKSAAQAGGPSDLDVLASMNVAFELSSVAMLMVDDSLHIVAANPAARQLWGADPLVGRSVPGLSVADTAEQAEREKRAWLSGDVTHLERETDLLAGTGETLRAVIQLDAVMLPSGRRYFLTQLRDVTADRRQQKALAAGAAQFRQLADSIPDSSVMLFDRDLRLLVTAGELMTAYGFTEDLAGELMVDVFPTVGLDQLEGYFRAALTGRASDFTYASPVGGRHFRVRARPLVSPDGDIVGGMSVMQDVTADKNRATQLAQRNELGRFAGSSYDRRTGWAYEPALLDMWGIGEGADIQGLPGQLLVSDERDAASACWTLMLREAGRHTLSYTIIHGRTGQLRHLQCTIRSDVDAAGNTLNVVATHVDITEAVAVSRRAESVQATAAQERSRLLRELGDILATSRLGPDQLLQSVVDLAARTLGEGAAIRVLSPDHRTIDRDVIAHPDESIRLRLAASLERSAREPVPDVGIVSEVVEKGILLSDSQERHWRPEYHRIFAERVFDQAAHMMVAPIRHKGTVLGKLAVFRTDPGNPYQADDDDVLQLLADGAGTAIAENRTWQRAETERDQWAANLRRQHQELLENLAGMETRERSLVAEAIHDEPIQSIVAGILRLDHLSTQLDPASRAVLDDVTEQLVTTVDWLRNLIVVALTPPDLGKGLGPALADLARSIFAATPTVFTVSGFADVPLGASAKQAAYRIFREALGNVRKHANAHKATLRMDERDGHVVISLTDDGVGSASLDAGTGHFGMATMRARAGGEGGQLHVESVSGLGTVVTLSMPAWPHQDAQVAGGSPESLPVDTDCLRLHPLVQALDQAIATAQIRSPQAT